jgi:hypothetical protein
MNAFPLAPFLYALSADGISVSFDDYDRISTVLGTGDKWTRDRLRGVLLALLAHNKEEAERFGRRFDSFFPEPDNDEFSAQNVQTFLIQLREIAEEANKTGKIFTPSEGVVSLPSSDTNRSSSGSVKSIWASMLRRPLFWCLAIPVLLAGGWALYRVLHKPTKIKKTEVVQAGPTDQSAGTRTNGGNGPTSQPVPQPIGRLPRDTGSSSGRIRVNTIDAVQALPVGHRWVDLAASFGVVAFLILFWSAIIALVSRALKDPPPQFNPNSPRLFPFSALGESSRPQLDGPTLDQLADSINYFLSARPSKRLDIAGTIAAT